MGWNTRTVSIANNGTASEAFSVDPWLRKVGVIFPAMNDGAIGIEVTNDGGTTWYPVIDLADGADLDIVASGSEPCYVDITDYLRAIPNDAQKQWQVRFTCASQTGGARTVTIVEHE
jgi:hypothetical protein